ncbi:MAG: 23S rRNA (adenine(2503)-C(2))-methyltransferase RlmN [Vicinamibacteria bacterium]|nr:23S rRNA (adenine(2503)-C(2))-methyltransferase RlmN [Vicinamibacteria bacterium]
MVVADRLDLLSLSTEELGLLLDSRARAFAVRRWLDSARPAPGELPRLVPGVTPRAWDRVREACRAPRWRIERRDVAEDGTVKCLIGVDGARIETVLIPGRGRSTVCVSSQAGCSRRCRFCATAGLGFVRQLSPGEIVLQYLIARAEAPPGRPARNVVFMGMGEPMDNLDAVRIAIERLTERPAPCLAARHITVSTSGVLPEMRRFLATGRGSLALSLNGTTDEQRIRLMPHARQWPIAELIAVLRENARRNPSLRHLVVYVLWAGVNDSDEDAERLAALLDGVSAHVNLIPHNPFPESPLRPPSCGRILRFHEILRARGVRCLVRAARGAGIAAACGQLALRSDAGRTNAEVGLGEAAPRER